MFGNMGWIITKTESKNAESVERLSVCSLLIEVLNLEKQVNS